jgi:hypothetical protein
MRIRRLEDALAQLQKVRNATIGITAEPGRPAIPVATPAAEAPHQAPTDLLWEMGKRALASPARIASNLAAPPGSPRSKHAWLFYDSIAELRAILRMFTDPRYRLSWIARIVPPVLIGLFLVSWYWVPFTSFAVVGTILNKAVDLVLAYALFRLLAHEARRYRETAPDLPPSLRL